MKISPCSTSTTHKGFDTHPSGCPLTRFEKFDRGDIKVNVLLYPLYPIEILANGMFCTSNDESR